MRGCIVVVHSGVIMVRSRSIVMIRGCGIVMRIAIKGHRVGYGHISGASVVYRGKLVPVMAGSLLVLFLYRGVIYVVFTHGHLFLAGWAGVDATGASIITHAVIYIIINDGPVDIRIMDHRCVDMSDGRIISEVATRPFTTVVTMSSISVAVVNTSIEADVGAPITAMPAIVAACETPITRRPEIAYHGGGIPVAGDPIIAVNIVICPITGDPEVSVRRTWWLIIDGYGRGCDANRDPYADLCAGRRGRKEYSG